MNKLQFFEETENRILSHELKDKIYSLISGYTLKQILDAFKFLETELKE